jgi:CelD/BcsL family acetyltransferase involved in cellulose biosynthesis
MNVVPIRSLHAGGRSLRATDLRIARVEIFDDMAAAEMHWRALEAADSLATPYQYYDFHKQWQRHVGSDSGVKPFIVVGFNGAQILTRSGRAPSRHGLTHTNAAL